MLELKHYLKEIGKHSLLSAEEEKELAGKIEQGDEEARKKLIQSNLRLVIFVAKRYTYRFPHLLPDFIQEGNIGLLRAADTFNRGYECRFSTYAIKCIERRIIRSLENLSDYQTTSLDEPAIKDGEKTIGDYIKDENAADPSLSSFQMSLKKLIAESIAKLEPEEQEVINAIFELENNSLEDYQKLNLGAKKSKALFIKALKKLKKDSNLQRYRA